MRFRNGLRLRLGKFLQAERVAIIAVVILAELVVALVLLLKTAIVTTAFIANFVADADFFTVEHAIFVFTVATEALVTAIAGPRCQCSGRDLRHWCFATHAQCILQACIAQTLIKPLGMVAVLEITSRSLRGCCHFAAVFRIGRTAGGAWRWIAGGDT